jgi:hypothetical protein
MSLNEIPKYFSPAANPHGSLPRRPPLAEHSCSDTRQVTEKDEGRTSLRPTQLPCNPIMRRMLRNQD